MPHDINGRPLKKGDIINIPCVILPQDEGHETDETINAKPIHDNVAQSYFLIPPQATELRLPAELVDLQPTIPGAEAAGRDLQIIEDKNLRVQVDALIETVKNSPFKSAERTLAYRQLQLAKAWLGFDLQELGTPNPYPNSRDTSNTVVDKTADTVKS